MAGKRYYETKEILNDTLALINKDRNEWRKFLTFVSKHYKFDFEDILLIYAQRPEATAVTDMYTWNNSLDRRIKRGTRSIAVFDDSSKTGLKYLFDVEDTYGAQLPQHWQLEERHEDDIIQLFSENFKKEYAPNLNAQDLDNIIDMKIREDCTEYMEGLYDDAEESYLEELDRHNIEIHFLSTVMDCVGHIVNERTGLNTGGNVNRELSFSAIWEFNTTELKMRLYNAIHQISKDILTTIEHLVKSQNKQKLINERSKINEHNIQRNERNTLPGHKNVGKPQADSTVGQVRQNGAQLSESGQTAQGTGNENQRNTERDLPSGGQGSGRNDDNVAEAVAGEEPDTEPQRLYGNSSAQENDTGPGGGDNPERDSIQNEITGKEEKNGEGAETTAPSLVSKEEIYDEEEKDKYIAELARKYEEQDIKQTLLRGSGFAGGKQRIVDFFAEEHTAKEKHDFLKSEYGTGGWSDTFEGNRRGFSNHDSKGIEILNQGIYGPAVRLSWTKVTKRIEELIENGKYFEKRYELDKPPVRPQNSIQQLSLLVQEKEAKDTEILKDYGYTWDGMELLDNHEAIELFNEGAEIYLLHDDNTESLVFENERELLLKHIADGGLIGIEKQKIPIEELIEEDEGAEEAPFLVKENSNTSEPIDYTITNNNLGIGGPKEKYIRNTEAIRLLKQIESEDRLATFEEQSILSQYVGWGGLPNVFDKSKSDWASEYFELKELLNDDEYESARASTLNAHYTSPIVIKSMYEALSSFGFKRGNILEPAMGIGNFFGCMPEDMRSGSHLTGVELDSISGRIAKQLYQSAGIHITGFERVNLPDNCFDVVIGNVPFGNYKVTDNKYDKYNFLIHDYFIAKSLDMMRPNGIIAVITSKGTMDKISSSFREYLAKRAELVGAIRLPNNAFKQNAGTEVTSDILFFQKRDRMIDIKPEWVDIGQTWDGIPVNQYYADNQHMLLGKMAYQTGPFGEETACIPFENSDLEEQLKKAITHLTAEITLSFDESLELEEDIVSIPASYDVKNYSYTLVEDDIYYRENSIMIKQELSDTYEKRIRDMINLRTAVREVIDVQTGYGSDAEFEAARLNLNSAYDNFAKTHGNINTRAVELTCVQDADFPLLSSLEVIDDEGNITKADMFFKRTIKPYITIDHADTSAEALTISLNEKGKVDIEYMAQLTKQEPETVITDLEGVIFKNPATFDIERPYDNYETADEYLSGNVRDKLRLAQEYLKEDPSYNINVSMSKVCSRKTLKQAR